MDALAAGNLTAIMILSLKTGAILGTSWLGSRQIVWVSLSFGALLFGLSRALWPYTAQLAWLVERYTFPVSLAIAVLFIYLGLNGDSSHDGETACRKPGVLYFGVLLPCPFCLLATAFGLMLFKQRAGYDRLVLDLAFSVVLTMFLLAVAFGVRKLSERKKGNSLKTMNSLLLLMGTTTVVMVFLVPNLVNAAQTGFSRVQVDSMPMMLGTWAAAGVLMAAGYFTARRKRL